MITRRLITPYTAKKDLGPSYSPGTGDFRARRPKDPDHIKDNREHRYGQKRGEHVRRHNVTQRVEAHQFEGVDLLIGWVCCYKGYHSRFGAEGVSAATTQAVVNASVLILVCDYLVTSVVF